MGLLSALLIGCTSTGATRSAAEPVPQEPAQKSQMETEEQRGFSEEVLYKLLVGEFAARRGQLELTVKNYLDAARATRDPGIAERATRIAVFARDEPRGLEAASLWTEVAPDSIKAQQVRAALLMRLGRVDEAVEVLAALLAGQPPEKGFAMVGEMLSREKNKDLAVEIMDRLVSGLDDDGDALFPFAALLARAGETARAVSLLERALAENPDDARIAVFYARVLQGQGDTARALQALESALERDASAHNLRMTYARLLVDAKRFEQARSQFERLVADAPDNPDMHFALGLLLLQTSRPEEARQHFAELLRLGKRTRTAHYYLGQIAESEKDTDGALAAYRKVDRGEHYLNAQIRVAVLLANKNDLQQARQHLHGLSRSHPQLAARIYRAEAELLSNAEQLDAAMAVYDTALEEKPGDTDLLYARAMLAARLDRLEILERDLREILSKEPDHAEALNALGYTLADKTDRLDEAMELIQRALSQKPNDYYILDSMGWVLYRLGRYQEAVEYLRRALALKDDPEIAAHLGEVLWVMGRKDDAREVWDTALETTPGDKRILDAIKRFSD